MQFAPRKHRNPSVFNDNISDDKSIAQEKMTKNRRVSVRFPVPPAEVGSIGYRMKPFGLRGGTGKTFAKSQSVRPVLSVGSGRQKREAEASPD